MPKYYIGLAITPHDPAIAIIDATGNVIFAEAAERYLQNKRAWNSLPDDLIRIKKLLSTYCGSHTEIVIATTWTDKFINQLRFFALGALSKLFMKKLDLYTKYLFKSMVATFHPHHGNNTILQQYVLDPAVKVTRRAYSHHDCHAAAACYGSGFGNAACLIIDGFAENSNVTFYSYQDGIIKNLNVKKSKGSLGEYYGFLCKLCGFESLEGEEWKVMGLAAYGKYNEKIYQLLKKFIHVKDGVLVIPKDKSEVIQQLLQLQRKPEENALLSAALAFTGQQLFVEIVVELVNHLYKIFPSENLVLSGGCALNSACNGLLLEKTPFKNLYVNSAPADDGNAIGAALLAYYQDKPWHKSKEEVQSPYLGSYISDGALQRFETYNKKFQRIEPPEGTTLSQFVAKQLSEGKIIGWVQGAAEFGPRALGNRSILADPRSKEVKDKLNNRVKFREEFRPFAPSILHEHGQEYFENYQFTPYMERALYFKENMIDRVPGVVHVDRTGRLQSVTKNLNSKYHELISEFYKLTGIPLVLNTSFNIMGKPIIHSFDDALAVFLTSGLDVLVVENHIFSKN